MRKQGGEVSDEVRRELSGSGAGCDGGVRCTTAACSGGDGVERGEREGQADRS